MAFAFVRRTAKRTGPPHPDKNHLHHRLLRLGHGHRRSVLILWAWTVLLSGFILFPLYISSVNAIIPFGALALGMVLYPMFHPSLRRQPETGLRQSQPNRAPTARSPRGPTGPVLRVLPRSLGRHGSRGKLRPRKPGQGSPGRRGGPGRPGRYR